MSGEETCAGDEWCSGWGWWQVRLALLLALPVLLTGAYGTNYVFLAAPAHYRCLVPECEDKAAVGGEWSARPEPWGNFTLPEDQCRRLQPLDGSCSKEAFGNSTQACGEFVYQNSGSIVVEFELACQDWKRSLVGTVHNVGMLISLPILGFVSDKWGRRAALVVSGSGAGVLGLMKSFVSSYPMYLVGELLETILGASVYPAAFVLMIEWLGVQHRILASLVLGIPLALGAASLSLLDYLTGYWRLWARWAYPPSFLLLLYPWLLPESVRWLVTRCRVDEAVTTIKRAAAWNRVEIPEETFKKVLANEKTEMDESQKAAEESLIKALIKYSVLRVRLCVCIVWWMSTVFVFYGLAANTHALSGSPHVNYALIALAQVPALIINTLLLDRVGRRPLLTAAFLITGASLIGSSLLPQESWQWGTALYLCGQLGATMSLNGLYVYTAELFPTSARHRLLATCSTFGRLGSILAPMTPLLAKYRSWIPTMLFGALPLVSAALTRAVPDTLRKRLPDTFADLEPTTHIREVA